MPLYPTVDTDRIIASAELLHRAASIFSACGMNPADAHLLADSLVRADLRGVHSHGVLRVLDYVKKLTREGVNPAGRPRIAKETGAVLVVDGGNAMGQIACDFAMGQAIDRAATFGIGAAAIRGSNHCGALFYCAEKALSRDMIGIAGSNALPTMAPWGGRDKILGINPLAVAIPSHDEPPIIFDGAFSASSHGKIRIYHQKGLAIPEGWAFDSDGHPTTDSARALTGLLQPIGGFKGVGMAVVVGILSSLLSGAAFGTELGNMVDGPKPGLDGQFVMAINVVAFEEPTLFKSRVDGIVRQIRNSAPAPGVDRCYAPGEIEFLNEQRYANEGIPLNRETLDAVAQSERLLGLA